MTKCKTEGCVNEQNQSYVQKDDVRRGYCYTCIREFRHLSADDRVKVLAARRAIDELWDAIMNLDNDAKDYFITLINDCCMDEKNSSDDHNIIWQ